MSYTPTTWVDGETLVNASRLNKMEQGIAAADESAGAAVKTVNGNAPDSSGNVDVLGNPGADGQDGVSCTHSWNGTVLTVTSASGTSSADLKGDKGDKGDTGAAGSNGTDGSDGQDGVDGVGIASIAQTTTSTADGGNNVFTVTLTNGTTSTFTVKNGSAGATGPKPVKGTDYFTEAEKAEFSTYIATELAKRGQLKPEFSQTIAECTDTTKLYVLPDGYIYAYMLAGKAYKNLLKESSVGYKAGYRLSSSGAESTQDWSFVTGFVPCKLGDVVRLQNIGFAQSGCDDIAASNLRISFYTAEKTHIAQTNAQNFNQFFDAVYDADGYIDQFTIKAFNSNTLETAAYFRLNATYMGDDSVITINEEITEGAAYKWTNTGHAFVPADYEDRIIELEEHAEETDSKIADYENRLTAIEKSDNTDIPDYVQTAAKVVARTVNGRQNENSMVFAFLADGHCGWGSDATHEAVKQSAQAVETINNRCPLDFVAHGGDLSVGGSYSTIDSTFTDIEDYTEIMAAVSAATPTLWMVGNHDDAPYQATADRLTQAQTFALIGRKNLRSGAVFNGGCNYGYLDIDSRKVRVIYLDTHDKRSWGTVRVTDGGVPFMDANNIGGEQLQWLADTALDFSNNENPEEWAVVVLSHVALNSTGTITDAVSGTNHAYSTTNAATILAAYRDGGSGSITHNGVTVNYNFSALTKKAEICCAVHGHNHMYSNETVNGIVSIGCPNVMNGRERQSADGNTYTKTEGTAQGTSFCVITVDRQNRKIYADHYGAGYDREFSY